MLTKLEKLPNLQSIMYRVDCLGIPSSTPRQTEKLRQSIIKLFKDHHLVITIEVYILDVALDLENDNYRPHRKPGDKPLYVNTCSN